MIKIDEDYKNLCKKILDSVLNNPKKNYSYCVKEDYKVEYIFDVKEYPTQVRITVNYKKFSVSDFFDNNYFYYLKDFLADCYMYFYKYHIKDQIIEIISEKI